MHWIWISVDIITISPHPRTQVQHTCHHQRHGHAYCLLSQGQVWTRVRDWLGLQIQNRLTQDPFMLWSSLYFSQANIALLHVPPRFICLMSMCPMARSWWRVAPRRLGTGLLSVIGQRRWLRYSWFGVDLTELLFSNSNYFHRYAALSGNSVYPSVTISDFQSCTKSLCGRWEQK